MNWYVLKTKPKKENSVLSQLQRASFDVFFPKIKGLSLCFKPLFPSYLFIKTDFTNPRMYQMIRFTRGVHQILGNYEGPQSVSEIVVDTLKERTKDGSLIEQDLLFKEGEAVSVKKGILKDLVGIIERKIPESGRIRVLFKWLSGNLRAELKYTELERAA